MPTSTQSTDRLSSLPSELLLEILGDLDDLDLYHFILTSRILHHCALNVLFQRHCTLNGLSECGALTIDTNPKPPFLLSAITRALFVTNLRMFYIGFNHATFLRLLADIRALTTLIGRSPGAQIVQLSFAGTAHLNLSPTSESQLLVAAQSLAAMALNRGCRSLTISSFDPGKQEGPRRGVYRLLHPFVTFFTATRSTKPEQTESEESTSCTKDDEEGSDAVDLAARRRSGHKERNHKLVPSKSAFHKDTNISFRSGRFCLDGEMPFRPRWLNWTLKFLNSDLSALTLYTDRVSRDVLYNILPNVYLPALTHLSLSDRTISFVVLGVFLQRHSSTLTNLSLFIERPDSSQSVDSDGETRLNRVFAKRRVAFDFPKLGWLSLTTLCIQWLFKGILAFRPPTSGIRSKLSNSRPHTHLPNFKMLNIPTIYVHSNQSSFFPQLEKALLTLAEFVKLASLHAIDDPLLGNAWFSFIGLHTDVIDEQSHIEWFRSHTSKGATSPLLALHTISDFYLSPIPNLGPEGLRALFNFLSLFKGLKKLMLILESTKALKKLDPDFWKAVRRDCPGLETLVLQTPPTASEVTVESLINGTPF